MIAIGDRVEIHSGGGTLCRTCSNHFPLLLGSKSARKTLRHHEYSTASFRGRPRYQNHIGSCKTKNDIYPTPRYAGRAGQNPPIHDFCSLISQFPPSAALGLFPKLNFSFNDFFSGGGAGSGGLMTGGTGTRGVEVGGGSVLYCFIVIRSGAIGPLGLRSTSGRSESVVDFSAGIYFGIGLVRTLSV